MAKQESHHGQESLTWAFRIVWYGIKEQEFKSQPFGYKHRFFYDLGSWPRFWPDITNFQTHWRYHEDNDSDWTESMASRLSLNKLNMISNLIYGLIFAARSLHSSSFGGVE